MTHPVHTQTRHVVGARPDGHTIHDVYGLVGGIGQYEDIGRMAYVRGPEGIIVALAQRIG